MQNCVFISKMKLKTTHHDTLPSLHLNENSPWVSDIYVYSV